MHEVQPTPEPAAAKSAPPPVTSLKGYWAIVLPLLALLAQVVIGFVAGFFAVAIGMQRGGSPLLIIWIAGLSALSYLLIVRIILARRGWSWRDLGLTGSASAPIIVAIVIGLGTCVLASLFERAVNPAGSLFRSMSGFDIVLAALVIGGIVPFAEEIVFRGVVFPVLRARIGDTLAAVMVSALIFGVFHLYPLQILVGFFLGLPLAWLRHWSGSLAAPIALHATHNLGVVVLASSAIF